MMKHSYHSDSSLDQPPHMIPSNHHSQHAPDDHDGLRRSRLPLTPSAGNSQVPSLTALTSYHNHLKLRSQGYPVPTLPSQPPRHLLRQPLPRQPAKTPGQLRRQDIRKHKYHRQTKNPIADYPQYSAYRQRQANEGKQDQKWPDILEDAFLDALMDIPRDMHKCKFSYNGKPHGRNELIRAYIWIAYCLSLSPGQTPDQSMMRSRKQVSSHIQVLKGFMKGDPHWLNFLFPKGKRPKNGFEDNFKIDPTLRAISEGRLPAHRMHQYQCISPGNPLRPALFWIHMTSCRAPPSDSDNLTKPEGNGHAAGVLSHKYTELASQGLSASLETLPDWRTRFPYLERLHDGDDLDCDIVHMDVTLALTSSHAPEGSDLVGRITMSMPGRELSNCSWQSVTTLSRPHELHRDFDVDPLLNAVACPTEVLSVSDAETQIKVPFPANAWAHTFTSLMNIQLALEERKLSAYGKLGHDNTLASVRHYIEQITMYQELESRSNLDTPYIKRAILLWTFRKARAGETGRTTWRYLEPSPPRHQCMSPTPPPEHHELAAMNVNFQHWEDNNLHPHEPQMLDRFGPELSSLSHTTTPLHSPFSHATSFNPYHPSFPIPEEHISFGATQSIEGESTLHARTDHTSTHHEIDGLLASSDVHASLDYHNDPSAATDWHLPVTSTESFDSDAAWSAYTMPPSTAPQMVWDSQVNLVADVIKHGTVHAETWHELQKSSVKPVDDDSHVELERKGNELTWMDEGHQQGAWVLSGRPVLKQTSSFLEPSLEVKDEWDLSMVEMRSAIKPSESFVSDSLERRIADWQGSEATNDLRVREISQVDDEAAVELDAVADEVDVQESLCDVVNHRDGAGGKAQEWVVVESDFEFA